MFYVYVSARGKQVELSFPIGQAPEKTKFDNVVYTRDRTAELASKQFVLKGGGWPSQDTKRKEQMTKANLAAGRRTRKTWGAPKKVIPNYQGEVTETWEDAKALAKKRK